MNPADAFITPDSYCSAQLKQLQHLGDAFASGYFEIEQRISSGCENPGNPLRIRAKCYQFALPVPDLIAHNCPIF